MPRQSDCGTAYRSLRAPTVLGRQWWLKLAPLAPINDSLTADEYNIHVLGFRDEQAITVNTYVHHRRSFSAAMVPCHYSAYT